MTQKGKKQFFYFYFYFLKAFSFILEMFGHLFLAVRDFITYSCQSTLAPYLYSKWAMIYGKGKGP